MLRKRSRPSSSSSSSKQPTVSSDHNNSPPTPLPPPETSLKPTPSLFISPAVVKGIMSAKEETENPVTSPCSVLETKPFSAAFSIAPLWFDRRMFTNPFTQRIKKMASSAATKQTHQQRSWDQSGIGVALIDEKKNPTDEQQPKQMRSNLVVFGSQLRIQIPPPSTLTLNPTPQPTSQFPPNSPSSPVEFGIKTPRSNLGAFGGIARDGVEAEEGHGGKSEGEIKESISMEEMELSEDYTRVISRGPNPKTTHIFGNCVVGSRCGSTTTTMTNRKSVVVGGHSFSGQRGRECKEFDFQDSSATGDFLSFCQHCKKRLGHGRDIYMYRGEMAFCSQECRGQGMLFDGVES